MGTTTDRMRAALDWCDRKGFDLAEGGSVYASHTGDLEIRLPAISDEAEFVATAREFGATDVRHFQASLWAETEDADGFRVSLHLSGRLGIDPDEREALTDRLRTEILAVTV